MYKFLDNLYSRFSEAYQSFIDPDRAYRFHDEGRDWGQLIGYAKVTRQLEKYDPYQFDNQHFKMGYYYAKSQVERMINDDEDNSVD